MSAVSTNSLPSAAPARVSPHGDRLEAADHSEETPTARVEALYRRFGPVLFSRCRRILKDPAQAEDAAHEVFMRIQKHLNEVPDDRAALAWIYRASTNYCLNVLRSRRTQAEPVAELPETAGANPERALLDRTIAMRLLAETPEKLAAPALLYYVDGLEQEEVARVLGVSRRTVINRLGAFVARSRRTLARLGVTR
jgi:RNA polymerase sigma-70 factor (ECF subfamily)